MSQEEMSNCVIVNGKMAILINVAYGGWGASEEDRTDPKNILAFLSEDPLLKHLALCWIPVGKRYRIDEYEDGWETLVIEGEDLYPYLAHETSMYVQTAEMEEKVNKFRKKKKDIQEAKNYLCQMCNLADLPEMLDLVKSQGLWKGTPEEAMREIKIRAIGLGYDDPLFLEKVEELKVWIFNEVGSGIGY